MRSILGALTILLVAATAHADTALATLTFSSATRSPVVELVGPHERVRAKVVEPEGNGRVAIAIVLNGQEVWIGNETLEPADSPARYPGALPILVGAFQELDLAHTLPPGSEAAVISYAERVEVRHPMQPVTKLPQNPLGTERDSYRRIGTDLTTGIRVGLDELATSTATHKFLFILGDGNDTNIPDSIPVLEELRRQADKADVFVHAIVWKGLLSDEATGVTAFDEAATTVRTAKQIVDALRASLHAHAFRLRAAFPVQPWMRDQHPVLVVDGIERRPTPTLSVPSPPSQRSEEARSPWWLSWGGQLGVGCALVGVFALLARWRTSRR